MTWVGTEAPGATPLQQVLGLRPELQPLVNDYLAAAWAASDPVVLELCRLRIAALHGDRTQQRLRHDTAVAAGLTEQQVADLPRHHDSPLFTDHQRRCIAYAEQYVLDVHGITDAQAEAIRAVPGDDGFVAFTVALGLFDGLGRMRLALGLDDDEPDVDGPVLVPSPRSDSHPY
jgi:alkylhydroperoxidase family enzyme